MAFKQVISMRNILRVAVLVCAFFVIKLAGRGFLLSILDVNSLSQFATASAMAVLFLVATVALFVAFGEASFSDIWLMATAISGLVSLIVNMQVVSCDGVTMLGPPYLFYYCSNPALNWFVGGLCGSLILIVVKRRLTRGLE